MISSNYTGSGKVSQKRRIYDYLVRFGSITQAQAFEDIGVSRLAARIADLRNDGVQIGSEWVKKTNRYGEPVMIKRYRLI